MSTKLDAASNRRQKSSISDDLLKWLLILTDIFDYICRLQMILFFAPKNSAPLRTQKFCITSQWIFSKSNFQQLRPSCHQSWNIFPASKAYARICPVDSLRVFIPGVCRGVLRPRYPRCIAIVAAPLKYVKNTQMILS
jgi:hypothetical protein